MIRSRRIALALAVAVVCAAGPILQAQGASSAAVQQVPAPPANGQQAPPGSAPAESPGAIYKEAMHPLDVVRSSLENWSDAELGALAVGMHMAREACEQAKPEDYSGDDLFDLARLCSLGQDWNDANSAASRYLDTRAEPHRAQAYAVSMNALVHLNGVDLATQTARSMLRGLPYDAEVAFAIRFMKDTLEQSGNPEGAKLAAQEHAAIVQALAQGVALKAKYGDAVIGVGALYESAMELAFWQRYAGDDAGAAQTVADIDGALRPAAMTLSAEDQKRIEEVRARYGLVGAPLPEVKVVGPLPPPAAKSARTAKAKGVEAGIDPDYGAATVLVVFPDWCAQCRRMMNTLTEFAVANKATPIHAYGLMFAGGGGEAPAGGTATPEENLKDVQGTATLLVSPETAQQFAASDYPLGVVVDSTGTIRFVGVLPGDAFNGDGYIEKVLLRMAQAAAMPKGGVKGE